MKSLLTSRIDSCTAVKVRERALGPECLADLLILFGRIVR